MSVVASDRDADRRRTAERARRVRIARLPIVGLFGGTTRLAPERAALARELGVLVARLGAHLLTASSYAVNEAAADGFASAAGRCGMCIGSVPRGFDGAFDKAGSADGAPVRTVELAIITPVRDVQRPADDSRLARLNLLMSNAILVLPGNDWIPGQLPHSAKCNGSGGDAPAQRRTILVGPAEEFVPELRGIFLQVTTAAAAAAPLCRIIEDERFAIEAAPLA
jgi:hypothetical protein